MDKDTFQFHIVDENNNAICGRNKIHWSLQDREGSSPFIPNRTRLKMYVKV